MKFDREILKFLEGKEFTNNLNVSIERTKYDITPRERAIVDLVRNSNVIHIGCSDHIPVIDEKIRNGKWLHKLLTDNTTNCIGIDIDPGSIEYLRKELGYHNVVFGDILGDEITEIKDEKWDWVVFGEIIEHLDDPVHFLRTFRSRYGRYVDRFIITVPSIYNKRAYENMLDYKEMINSDHRYWFTPYTISKVLILSGYNPEAISFTNLLSLDFKDLAIRKMKKILGIKPLYPFYYFNTMLVTGTIN